jgi:hypothetical protein
MKLGVFRVELDYLFRVARAHMIRGYTTAFCQRTQEHCRAQVSEEFNTIYFKLK